MPWICAVPWSCALELCGATNCLNANRFVAFRRLRRGPRGPRHVHSKRRARSVSPGAIRAALASKQSRWGGSRQQDAHELLLALLDMLHCEVMQAQVRWHRIIGLKQTCLLTHIIHLVHRSCLTQYCRQWVCLGRRAAARALC